jgi:NAD(P)-dependent dehydrogenase (short-subunit alcohol dehydrogenase family)
MGNQFLNTIFKLEDKVVAVTGACGQLGSAICKFYTDAGATVIGMDVSINERKNDASQYIALDIRKRDDVKSVLTKIFNEYGQIDILVNNAGVSTFEPFEERPEDRFDWVMDVNLKGTFNCIQKYVELYDSKKMDKGCIINIASMYGMISPDFRIYTDCDRKNSEVYGATKAGLIQMTRYFAVHLADRNICVNSVSPGGVYNRDNPQGEDFIKNYSFRCPMKRMADDKEIAGAVLYLSSDIASYTTGQNIAVDGGMTCW